jgi:spoIIIJ-associated protein
MKSFLDFEEKNVEKAVQKACDDLNVKRDKLKYDIISHGSSGIFGLVGTKKALIRVFVPDLPNGKPGPDAAGIAGHVEKSLNSELSQSDTVNALVDEAFGEIKQSIDAAPLKPKKIKKSKKSEQPKQPEQNKKSVPQKKEIPVKAEKPVKPEKSEKVEKTEESHQEKEPSEISNAEPQDSNNEAAIAVAQDLGREIFKTMSIDAEMTVKISTDQCWINVKVEEPGILIGKRGQTLEAIQYLVD